MFKQAKYSNSVLLICICNKKHITTKKILLHSDYMLGEDKMGK